LLYQTGLFIGTMGTNYRFEFSSVAASMIVGVALAKLLYDRRDDDAIVPEREAASEPPKDPSIAAHT
jgi:hypothetical protein